MTAKQRLIGES